MKRICILFLGCVCSLGFAAADSASTGIPFAKPASSASSGDSVEKLSVLHGPADLGLAVQAKLDSISEALARNSEDSAAVQKSNRDAKAKSDSLRTLLNAGQYVGRANYDKRNFDTWKVDTVYQKKMKTNIIGTWRTPIQEHGHAFLDAELRFGANDTLYGTTRTYSDSGRYQMTGEYKFHARYRFDNDSMIVSREVFKDRQVVRWDFIHFKISGDKLSYHLTKLEFRDLNDNWLNALQGFDKVAPEVYLRQRSAASEAEPILNSTQK